MDDNFDWSSVEQVTALVSKTTLAGLQQQWKTHAVQMDQYGRTFAESMYNAHSQVIKVSARACMCTLEGGILQQRAMLGRWGEDTGVGGWLVWGWLVWAHIAASAPCMHACTHAGHRQRQEL